MEIDDILKEFNEEIEKDTHLDIRMKEISKLSVFVTNNSFSLFKRYLFNEIKILSLNEIYEVVLHLTPYIGASRSYEFLSFLSSNFHISSSKVNLIDKIKEGNNKQVEIFGENMKDYHLKGDEYHKLINKYLALNCFGDYYTRASLSLKERELIVFNALYVMGDCNPQLKSHIKGNLNMGNDKELLIKVILNNLPYVGYPKSLNALNILKEVCN